MMAEPHAGREEARRLRPTRGVTHDRRVPSDVEAITPSSWPTRSGSTPATSTAWPRSSRTSSTTASSARVTWSPTSLRRRIHRGLPDRLGPSDEPVRGERRRSEEHTSELQSPYDLVCRLLLEKKKT